MHVRITARRFDFPKLVLAHGWAFLPPFEWSDAARTLCRPLRLPNEKCVPVQIRAAARGVKSVVRVQTEARLSPANRRAVRRQVRRMLCLDQDFAEFHAMCRHDPVLGFVSRVKCGGLLRSPTAFEDLVKTVCTTNCDWRNTKKMSDALCALDGGGFPTPELVLKHSTGQLAARVPLGYRTATVRTIARLPTHLDKLPRQTEGRPRRREPLAHCDTGPGGAVVNRHLAGATESVPVRLQWGRAWDGAEIGQQAVNRRPGQPASMGPRLGWRGNSRPICLCAWTWLASMGPRLGWRGNDIQLAGRTRRPGRFNGAAPGMARK